MLLFHEHESLSVLLSCTLACDCLPSQVTSTDEGAFVCVWDSRVGSAPDGPACAPEVVSGWEDQRVVMKSPVTLTHCGWED